MDLNAIPLFQAVKKRLNWLSQRQEVVTQNIANADTPKYKAHDLKPYDFRDLVRREATQINMAVTQPNQLPGQRKRIRDFSDSTPFAYETAPNGNNVILEEQMTKLNESAVKHQLTTELYKKHLALLRMALTGQ